MTTPPRKPGSQLVPHPPHLARTLASILARAKRLEQRTRRESVVFAAMSTGVPVARADSYTQTHITAVARTGHKIAVDCFVPNVTQAVIRLRLTIPDFNITGPVIGNDTGYQPPAGNLDPGGEGTAASPISNTIARFMFASVLSRLASLAGLAGFTGTAARIVRVLAVTMLATDSEVGTTGGETGGPDSGTGSATGVPNPGGEGGGTSGLGETAVDTSGGRLITATVEMPGGWKIGDRHLVYLEACQPSSSPSATPVNLFALRAVQR